jgi:hypothetical protein
MTDPDHKWHRRSDGSIDLWAVYTQGLGYPEEHTTAQAYLLEVERVRPLVSSEAAATAIATARRFQLIKDA